MRSHQSYQADLGDELCGGHEVERHRAPGRGQGLVEYTLIILFVALAVVLALSLIAPTLNSIFRAVPPAL